MGTVGLFPITSAQTSGPVPAAPENSAAPPEAVPLRVRGLFDLDLPRFDPPGTFRLQFNPRFGDLLRRDYIRVPTGVRWAVNDRLELYAEMEAFATHGLDDNTSTGYGIGELRFGSRYLIRNYPWPDYQTSVGLNLEFPTGDPPPDFTDGRNHFAPYFVTEHRLPRHPRWTVFGGASADIVTDSSVPGSLGINSTKDDSISLNGGTTYDLGQVKWTLQATYTTTVISGIDEHFFTIRPSFLWWVPRKYTLNSKTQWIFGFGVRSTWGPDGYEFSTGSRVRAEITFRQALRRLRGAMDYRR
ncbi:MAG: hypothetical protein C0518_14500 [Opitutus sp.]|nr:hypothetical protein [Opitutus sp.]